MIRTLTRNTSADESLTHQYRIAAMPNTSAVCARQADRTEQHSKKLEFFKFGKVIRPKQDGLDRTQLCITKTMLAKIIALSRGRTYPELRKMERFVCLHQNDSVTRVVPNRFGWLAQNRCHLADPWLTLGDERLGFYLLFPTAEVAISAAEVIENAPPAIPDCLRWLG
jgi:hypothetical protein